VNPDERYTIDQFLAHPWIKAGEVVEEVKEPVSESVPEISIDSPAAAPENKILSNVAAMTPTYGAPKTPYKRRAENPLSPGIGLKEVFDVSNAVHRMEEESTRRRHAVQTAGLHPVDALNTSTRQRQAFMSQLNEEDEIDEEEEGSLSDETGSMLSDDEAVVVAGLSDVHISIDHAQEETTVKDSEAEQKAQEMRLLLQQQQQEYQKAQESIAAEHHQKYLAQQQEAGHTIPVQHSLPASSSSTSTVRSNQVGPSKSGHTISTSTSASTVASTSTTSSSRRRRAGFELNMNQATLLNRRAKNHPLAAGQTVEEQDESSRHDAPAMAV